MSLLKEIQSLKSAVVSVDKQLAASAKGGMSVGNNAAHNNNKKSKRKNKGKKPPGTTYNNVVQSNTSLANNVVTGSRKAIHRKTQFGEIVTHEELFSTVSGNTGVFSTSNSFNFNPGIKTLFPYLANTAKGYQQYAIRRLYFDYRTTTANTSAGLLIMAFDYDVDDPDPATLSDFSNLSAFIQGVSYSNLRLELDPKALMGIGPRRFVRSAMYSDLHAYDAGWFIYGVGGQASSASIGNVYVGYEVEFFQSVSPNIANTVFPANVSVFRNNTSFSIANAAPNAPWTGWAIINNTNGANSWDPMAFSTGYNGLGVPANGSFSPFSGVYYVTLTYRVQYNNNTRAGFGVGFNFTAGSTPVTMIGTGDPVTDDVCDYRDAGAGNAWSETRSFSTVVNVGSVSPVMWIIAANTSAATITFSDASHIAVLIVRSC